MTVVFLKMGFQLTLNHSLGKKGEIASGPVNSGCLERGEAGGIGEGWDDFFVTILLMKEEYNRTIEFGMGKWPNGGEGIKGLP
ncbi:14796_t:CDS:2, partial [Entrophospora sp. SA101]